MAASSDLGIGGGENLEISRTTRPPQYIVARGRVKIVRQFPITLSMEPTSVAATLQELAPHPAILVEVDEPLAVP